MGNVTTLAASLLKDNTMMNFLNLEVLLPDLLLLSGEYFFSGQNVTSLFPPFLFRELPFLLMQFWVQVEKCAAVKRPVVFPTRIPVFPLVLGFQPHPM